MASSGCRSSDTIPITFILMYLISKFNNSYREKIDRSGFEAQYFRAQSEMETNKERVTR